MGGQAKCPKAIFFGISRLGKSLLPVTRIAEKHALSTGASREAPVDNACFSAILVTGRSDLPSLEMPKKIAFGHFAWPPKLAKNLVRYLSPGT